ncbi:TetR/AcrR family transcriptional regulator [Streptomyces violaceusniger]|uniref:TetR/AcrR family transcriptional regulator n=1 Tax=Streptomyces violaceusniger TaxID=68280 RepID=UPI0036976BF0
MESGHNGDTSAVRGLELLWGLGERPKRGRRPAFTLEQIVRTAVGIADAEGLATVSMRRIAERLGCTTMSLYRYVPGKAELLELMTDTVMGEVPLADAAPGDWRTRLELSARADWGLYHRHPWILRLPAGRPALGPNGFAWYESVLRVLTATGLPPAALVNVLDLLDAYVRGAARDCLDAAAVEHHSGLTDEQWRAARAHFWDAIFVPARYPVLASLRAVGALNHPRDRGFEFGLQRVLDSIETFVRIQPNRHDETSKRYETDCPQCGAPVLHPAPTGRPRTYCSDACRQRAYRARRTSTVHRLDH